MALLFSYITHSALLSSVKHDGVFTGFKGEVIMAEVGVGERPEGSPPGCADV